MGSEAEEEPEAWRETLGMPELEELDRSLRCGICGEVLSSPVALPCSHAFCSVCIRRALAAFNESCPSCRAPCSSEQLSPARALAGAADAFRNCRPSLAALCKSHNPSFSHPEHHATPQENHPSNDNNTTNTSSMDPVVTLDHSHQSDTSYKGNLHGKDACPICGMLLPLSVLNSHVDSCLSKRETRSYTATPCNELHASQPSHQSTRREDSEPLGEDEHLPNRMGKLHYRLLSEKQMKQKAADCHLTTNHSKDTLAWMHSEFTHRYNAAIDGNKKPKPAAIAREVVRLERESEKKAGAPNASASALMQNKPHSKAGSNSAFQSLIENIKDRDGLLPGKRKYDGRSDNGE